MHEKSANHKLFRWLYEYENNYKGATNGEIDPTSRAEEVKTAEEI